MKKHLRKVSVILLTFVMLSGIFSVPALAEEESLPQTGLIWDTWDSILENLNETTLHAFADQRTGDVDSDGRITAADARLCLRAAAQLEELEYAQSIAADVNNSFDITSADARKILRFSAGLDTPDKMTFELSVSGWGCIIGPMKTTGSGRYFWHCKVNADGLSFTEETVESAEGKDGAPVESFFVFTPEKEGNYIVTFTLADSAENEILDTFSVNVSVEAETTEEEISSDMG